MFCFECLCLKWLGQGSPAERAQEMNSTDSTCACVIHWKPHDILDIESSDFRFVLLILNQPLCIARDFLLLLWNRASLRVTVDGGTNRWYKFLNGEECSPPEFITGDMDSANSEILSYFKNLGSRVVRTPDQNETDFTKALREVSKHITSTQLQVDAIVAICEHSGRLDQTLTNINTLHKAKDLVDVPVYLLSNGSLSWLLRPGMHYIHVGQKIVEQGRWCSLIPVGARVDHVTTTGLKWNLDSQSMQFGELISSSNTYSGDPTVTVKTDGTLLWSIGLKDEDT